MENSRKNPSATPFVSKADTKEIREYQDIAAHYPPMPHEQLIATAKVFVAGRNARVALMEEERLNEVFQGDWSDTNILDKKQLAMENIEEFSKELKKDSKVPKDIADKVLADVKEMKRSYLLFVKSLVHNHSDKRKISRMIAKSDDALEDIVNHNLQLAMSRVGKMMKQSDRAKRIGATELISVSNVGLVLGARQFDPYAGYRFSTYASFHIDGQLYEFVNVEDGNCGIKSTTLHEQKQINAIIQAKKNFKIRYGVEPTDTELQSVTGITSKLIHKRVCSPAVKTQNIYAPISGSGREGTPTLIADLLATDKNVEDEIMSSELDEIMDVLRKSILRLPLKERTIIMKRMGLESNSGEKPKTVYKMSQELAMPAKEINSLITSAIAKLRLSLEKHGYGISEIMELD